MTALLKKQMSRQGALGEGCWAFDNTDDSTSVSGKFYGLVVPDRKAAQLDDLSWREEAMFWSHSFDVARDAAVRLDAQTKEGHAVLLGVNDGYYVGQSIPHVHSHIVVSEQTKGVEDFFLFREVSKAFDTLRQVFCPAANPPLKRQRIMCDLRDIEDFTWRLKYRREALREQGMDMFRIYTASSFRPDFRQIFFVVDATNSENPMFSFSQAWRALNERMPYERLERPLGRGKYTHFEPVI